MNTKSPSYLYELVNKQCYGVNSRRHDKLEMINVPSRTNKFKQSFLPSTIKDWNLLENEIKIVKSKETFKQKLLNQIRPNKRDYFGITDNNKVRYLTILRVELSPLHAHKHAYNFSDTPYPYCTICECTEDTAHFLLHCKSFKLSRNTLMQKVSTILGFNISSLPQRKIVDILLYGKADIDYVRNKCILEEVTHFIKNTKRLDILP